MSQQKPSTKNLVGLAIAQPAKTVWIENSQSTNQHSRKESNEIDEQFKKEHQQYLASKIARREKERKMMMEQFGASSSDEEDSSQESPQKAEKVVLSRDQRQGTKQEEAYPSTPQSQKSKHSKKPTSTTSKQAPSDECFKVLVTSKKAGDSWVQDSLTITQKIICLPNVECPYYELNKLKLIFSGVGSECFKLKVSWKSEQFIFGASSQAKYQQLPEAFYIFAKIIGLKLSLMGKKPLPHPESTKTYGLPEQILKNSFIHGKIFKKSRLISRWSEVLAVINKDGLHYFKKPSDKGELLVVRGKIEELWTRFEFQNEWLIVKLFENGHKIELGMPVEDELTGKRWLYNLYRLIQK